MSEIIPIVDEQDKIIDYKERSSIQTKDIYRVSALWVKDSDGNVLLAQRKFTKKHHPGRWGPAVAGTVNKDETYDTNIVKEISEEIGLKNIKLVKGPKRRVSGDHNHFTQWYKLTIDKKAEDFTIQETEVERLKWFTIDEVKEKLRKNPDDFVTNFDWPISNLL